MKEESLITVLRCFAHGEKESLQDEWCRCGMEREKVEMMLLLVVIVGNDVLGEVC